jgi:SAM-dependent methyltransferase
MRIYWDGRARANAPWYVDTSLSYDDPDMDRFWEQGERIVAEGLDEGRVQPSRTALAVEIGAGLGRNCRALASRFDAVVGLDISPEMVGRARQLVDDPTVRFELVDGASMAPVGTDTADLVFSFTVFQHIPRVGVIEAYIAEAGRVLRAGGVLAFQWNNEPGHRRWVVRRAVLGALQRAGFAVDRHQRHAAAFLGSRVPLSRIERALDRAGLDLVEVRGGGTLYAWATATRR